MSGVVAVALSGGVDSSVAALLLRERGITVIGVTLLLGDEAQGDACGGAAAVAAARRSCQQLGIAHHVVPAREPFARRVLAPAWRQYAAGRTPNPCVSCNPRIKFGLLFERAAALGAESLATGHHARVVAGTEPQLWRGRDRHKDQSYFLCRLTAAQLARTRLPVGELTKEEVWALARECGLAAAERPESQDACFAQRRDLASALQRRFGGPPPRAGVVRDTGGRVLGEHGGVHRFTVGQRKGLGVAAGHPLYVVRIDAARGEVVVGAREELLAAGLVATDLVASSALPAAGRVMVQIRYRHRAVPGWLSRAGDGATVRFDEPQAAVTPGQAAVFYDVERDRRLIGGGWIDRALPAGGG